MYNNKNNILFLLVLLILRHKNEKIKFHDKIIIY
jgi:hypothetical protein